MGFQLYSGNIDEGLKGWKAHKWVAKICLRNNWPSKLEISILEMCEKIFLLSEAKMKFPVEQKVFIVRVYYATKSYKKCGKNFQRNIVRFY